MHIFEKADKLGVDAASTTLTVMKDGKSLDVCIDVPMRSIDAGDSPENGAYGRLLSSVT